MAKVGNESKLILSLAEERSNKKNSQLTCYVKSLENQGKTAEAEAVRSGYELGIRTYKENLSFIVREIEER